MRRPDADGSDSESGSRNSPRQSVPDKVGAGQVMSDHLPSDNPSTWPRDPYKLLGVARGASEREVRRAYHNLIRKFKPEHAPEAFRRIREAYEAARNSGTLPPLWIQSFESRVVRSAERSAAPNPRDLVVERDADPQPTDRLRDPGRPADVWETACEGDVTLAYERLLERLEHGTPAEEVFLQLYWLRVAAPGQRDEQAVDWLIRGLRTLGPSTRRIQELVRREAEIDQTGVVCERLADLLSPGVAAELVLAAANWRWRAARRLKRWDVIMGDIDALRELSTSLDTTSWIQLLLAASGNGMWAIGGAVRKKAVSHRLEAERLALAYSLDVSDELNRIDYAECVIEGLRKLCPENRIRRLIWSPAIALLSTPDGASRRNLLGRHLYYLFRNSWDDRGARLRQRLLPYARALARDPRTALSHLDTLSKVAPAAFGLLMELMGCRNNRILDSTVEDEVEAFLERSRWSKYAAFRFNLLNFCQCQAIAPDIFAQAIAQHPGYLVMEPLSWHELASSPDLMELLRRRRSRKGARHLGVVITSDRPLAILFHAWQLARE